jgi:hypothetical protein
MQVCGEDGWCAAPAVAGTCAAIPAGPQGDAGSGVTPIDAASRMATLIVVVSGKGRVETDQGDPCENGSPNTPLECRYLVPEDTPATLVAIPVHHRWTFEGWSAPCRDDPGESTCSLVVASDTLVAAGFVESADREPEPAGVRSAR